METYYVTISILALYSKSAKTFLNTGRVRYFAFFMKLQSRLHSGTLLARICGLKLVDETRANEYLCEIAETRQDDYEMGRS